MAKRAARTVVIGSSTIGEAYTRHIGSPGVQSIQAEIDGNGVLHADIVLTLEGGQSVERSYSCAGTFVVLWDD